MNLLVASLIMLPLMDRPGEGGGGGSHPLGAGPALDQLSEVRAFDDKASLTDFATGLNRAVAGVRELGGDMQRVRTYVERVLPDLERSHAAAEKGQRAEYVPLGGYAEFKARYLNPDGSWRLVGRNITFELPDGTTGTTQLPGMLTERAITPFHARVLERYTAFGLAFRMARRGGAGNEFADKTVQRAFFRFRRSMEELPGEAGPYFRGVLESAMKIRAISGTNGSGGELILSPQLTAARRPLDLERRIIGLFDMRESPAKSFTVPNVTGRAIPYLRGTGGDDPARFAGSTFSTGSDTVTMKDRVVMAIVDRLFLTDTFLEDPMGFIRDWVDSGDGLAMEGAAIHGDTTATHEDTLSTWTVNGLYTAGALSGSNSPYRFWKGLRRLCVDALATASAGGTWDIADHTAALAAMGTHEANAVIITGLACLLTQLVGNSNFLTMDKMGPYASLITGRPGVVGPSPWGSVAGKPIFISQTMGKQFDTTSGLYTGSNLGNGMLFVNPAAMAWYDYMPGSEDIDEESPSRGTNFVGLVRRSQFVNQTVTGEVPFYYLYNL